MIRWFVADDTSSSCSCSTSHSTLALKREKGFSHPIPMAMCSAYHQCDLALWYMPHPTMVYERLTLNLLGRTSCINIRKPCEHCKLRNWCGDYGKTTRKSQLSLKIAQAKTWFSPLDLFINISSSLPAYQEHSILRLLKSKVFYCFKQVSLVWS